MRETRMPRRIALERGRPARHGRRHAVRLNADAPPFETGTPSYGRTGSVRMLRSNPCTHPIGNAGEASEREVCALMATSRSDADASPGEIGVLPRVFAREIMTRGSNPRDQLIGNAGEASEREVCALMATSRSDAVAPTPASHLLLDRDRPCCARDGRDPNVVQYLRSAGDPPE